MCRQLCIHACTHFPWENFRPFFLFIFYAELLDARNSSSVALHWTCFLFFYDSANTSNLKLRCIACTCFGNNQNKTYPPSHFLLLCLGDEIMPWCFVYARVSHLTVISVDASQPLCLIPTLHLKQDVLVLYFPGSCVQTVIGLYGETIEVPCNNGNNKPDGIIFTKWKYVSFALCILLSIWGVTLPCLGSQAIYSYSHHHIDF